RSLEDEIGIVTPYVLAGTVISRRALPRRNDRRLPGSHRHRVLVVLNHTDKRQLPQRCHVHYFVKGALIHRAVPVVRHSYAWLLLHLARQRDTGTGTHTFGDDAAAEEVDTIVIQVHVAAAAARKTGLLAEELRGHALEVHTPRDGDMVRPMPGTNGVVRTEMS